MGGLRGGSGRGFAMRGSLALQRLLGAAAAATGELKLLCLFAIACLVGVGSALPKHSRLSLHR